MKGVGGGGFTILVDLLTTHQINGITVLVTVLDFYPLVIANRAGLMLCGQILMHEPDGPVLLIT